MEPDERPIVERSLVHMRWQFSYEDLLNLFEDSSIIHLNVNHGVRWPPVVLSDDGSLALVVISPSPGLVHPLPVDAPPSRVEDAVALPEPLLFRHHYILGSLSIFNLGLKLSNDSINVR